MEPVKVNQLINDKNSRFSQILREIRIKESFYVKAFASEPWGFDNPPLKGALFHFMVEGSAEIEELDGNYIQLNKGDLVLLPFGQRHILRSGSDAPIDTFETVTIESRGENASVMKLGSERGEATIICGGLSFEPSWHPLLQALPPLLIQRASTENDACHIGRLITLMGIEVNSDLPGSETVINRLNEVLIIAALREWMLNGIDNSSSWIYALRDQFLGHSLVQIHTSPDGDWSVASLAKEAKMSRSVYSERFHKLVGMPPMQYVMRIRMNLAADKLRQSTETVERVATEVGYDSVVSFSRAFKRFWGEPPGKFKVSV